MGDHEPRQSPDHVVSKGYTSRPHVIPRSPVAPAGAPSVPPADSAPLPSHLRPAEPIVPIPGGPSLSNQEGVVKWFDPRKGFGFIVGPEGQDIFAHYSIIQGDGFRVLKDGSPVVYDAVKTDKGWKATRVMRTDAVEVNVVPRRGYTRTPRR